MPASSPVTLSAPGFVMSGGGPVVRFEVATIDLTVRAESDGPTHPDALDELSRRCLRLFVEANASLPEASEDGDA